MTGKQLKEFAAKVPDNAMIQFKERPYHSWGDDFTLKAVLELEMDASEKEGDEAPEPTV